MVVRELWDLRAILWYSLVLPQVGVSFVVVCVDLWVPGEEEKKGETALFSPSFVLIDVSTCGILAGY